MPSCCRSRCSARSTGFHAGTTRRARELAGDRRPLRGLPDWWSTGDGTRKPLAHTPARSLAGPRRPAPLPRGRAVRAAVMRQREQNSRQEPHNGLEHIATSPSATCTQSSPLRRCCRSRVARDLGIRPERARAIDHAAGRVRGDDARGLVPCSTHCSSAPTASKVFGPARRRSAHARRHEQAHEVVGLAARPSSVDDALVVVDVLSGGSADRSSRDTGAACRRAP